MILVNCDWRGPRFTHLDNGVRTDIMPQLCV